MKHTIEVVRGVCGLSVYLNGYRISGDKPWGGGQVVSRGTCDDDDLSKAVLSAFDDAPRTGDTGGGK